MDVEDSEVLTIISTRSSIFQVEKMTEETYGMTINVLKLAEDVATVRAVIDFEFRQLHYIFKQEQTNI